MDRRDAIKTIVGISSGLVLAPLEALAESDEKTDEVSDKVKEETTNASIRIDQSSGELIVRYDGKDGYSHTKLYGLNTDGTSIENLTIRQMDDEIVGIMRNEGRPFRIVNGEDNPLNVKFNQVKEIEGIYQVLYLKPVSVFYHPDPKITNPKEFVFLEGFLMDREQKVFRFPLSNVGDPDSVFNPSNMMETTTYPLQTQHPVIELIRQVASNPYYGK